MGRGPGLNSIKITLPSFKGTSDPSLYLDWELQCNHIFQLNELTSQKKAAHTIAQFEGYASTWWETKRLQRARNDNLDLPDWDELKALTRERYVTERYKQEQLTKLYNFRKGDRSVEEYYDELQNLILHLNIVEPPNHCLARFKSGLCYEFVSQLVVHKFDRIEDLVEAAIEVEKNNHAKKNFGWNKSYKPLEKKPFNKTI